MNNEAINDISNQIGINVITNYQRNHSNPSENSYIFAYQIRITNFSSEIIQLKSRQWFVFDSSGKQTFVNGEGVVGQNPVLKPGESFEYVSSCPLESPIGYMEGSYDFITIRKGVTFSSPIPKFNLTCPDILN